MILLIDIGSTFTKIAAVDLEGEEVVGRTYAASTVATDMTTGLQEAYEKLLAQLGSRHLDIDRKLACSSAAGGMRLFAIGLVPSLTTEAARRAAFGAGAKVIGTYSHELTTTEIESIERTLPDIVLLAGGTDGGNKEVILHNAGMLAGSSLTCPIVVAGNKAASDEVKAILETAGKPAEVTENVLPDIDRLNVDPCRSIIREVFIKRIVHGKGLDKAKSFIGDIIMPTPLAVLNGGKLLAEGTAEEPGIGELIVVDVGGATTDVVSVCEGSASQASVVQKGLPEPYAKRTVEGDLGIRYNAPSILELAGAKQLLENMKVRGDHIPDIDLEKATEELCAQTDKVPETETESLLDIALARTAVSIATERHAGIIESLYTPSGQLNIQRGKDLAEVKHVVGTGGIFAYGSEPQWILEGTRYDENNPCSLKPRSPEFLIDKDYILYGYVGQPS